MAKRYLINAFAVLCFAAFGFTFIMCADVSAGSDDMPPDISIPNVIFISLDTVRADFLACYGHPWVKTPNLDAFADDSIIFLNCMTVIPTTLASHVSLFTGKYPHTHGVPRNGFSVHSDNQTIAEILKDNGYDCAAFIGSYALSSKFNLGQGFSYYDDSFNTVQKIKARVAPEVTDSVMKYIDANPTDSPRFLFAHYWDAHDPYSPPKPYDTIYDGQDIGDMPIAGLTSEIPGYWQKFLRRYSSRIKIELPEDWQAMIHKYAGEISFLDKHLGRLFDGLKERGLYDNSLIVITSDHGETMVEHIPYFHHGISTYRDTMHIVCAIHLPNQQNRGKRIQEQISNIDIFPTVLSFLGLPCPVESEGNTIPLKKPEINVPKHEVFCQATQPLKSVETEPGWRNLPKARCISDGNFTFHQVPYINVEEMFDISEDPHEIENLLTQREPVTKTKAGALRSKLEKWAHSFSPLKSEFVRKRSREINEQLNALGYLE